MGTLAAFLRAVSRRLVPCSFIEPINDYAALCRGVVVNQLLAHGVLQWNEPMRFKLLKFIQIKNARPTIFASGTKPQ